MPQSDPFADLVQRVRAGDEAAAAELVQRYEPHIRRAVRMQLRDARLRRVLDSVDICQSVMAGFFVRAALGQFDLDTPEHLLKLLSTMARNKLATLARKPQVKRRVEQSQDDSCNARVAPDPSPSKQVAARELLEQVRDRLSQDERAVVEQRLHGREWVEIAAELGDSPEALRKRFTRAVDRISQELGLEDLDDA